MTIWEWMLSTGCVLLFVSTLLLAGRLTSEWKHMESETDERECRRKWGVDTW